MSTEEQIADFAAALIDEVRGKAEEATRFSTEAECFAEVVLEMFQDAGVLEDPEVCVRGGRLGRSRWEISGWAFPPSDDEDLSQLSILAILFHDDPAQPPTEAEDLRRTFDLAANFVAGMLEGRADDLEPAADAAGVGRLIYERRQQLRKVVVHLATDGLTQRLKEIESRFVGEIEIACSIWDIERLSRLSDPAQEEIEIDVCALLDGRGLPCLVVPEEDPGYDAFLCVVPGALLYHAYEQYGQRLLELNVRAFLSATGKVNKGIRETIRTNPDRFFAYNNGLAMTARRVELRKNEVGQDEIIRIVGLQIVNGGQTTASIHRAWKLDGARDEVERVFVQGKLTVVTTPEGDDEGFVDLVRSISKFANSQNAVKDDDLEANQPWHVSFAQLSQTTWTPDAQSKWYYERSRGSYATAKLRSSGTPAQKREFERRWPRSQLITKTDLAKAWNAWELRPEIVSRGGQKNFKEFMTLLGEEVRRPSLDDESYKRIVGRVILFRDTTRLVNQLKDRIPAYRANVVAYLVAYLAFRSGGLDFDRIWEGQSTPEPVKRTLQSWAEPIYQTILSTAAGRNVTEWCKRPECWAAVRSLRLDALADLSLFTTGNGASDGSGLVDPENAEVIADCMRLTPIEWEQLAAWTMQTRDIHPKVRGIVGTVRLYALDNWSRRPSFKQARSVLRAVDRWRQATGE